MAHTIQMSRAWCDECLRDCWFTFDEQSQVNQHIGQDNAHAWNTLKAQGYTVKHSGGGAFTFTLWKARPLALPLDWQMAIEERETKEPEYLENQDW